MENNVVDESVFYEKLSKEEQKSLQKEYKARINVRKNMVLRIVSILLVLLGLVTGIVFIYFIVQDGFFGKDAPNWTWPIGALFIPFLTVSLFISTRYFDGLFKWLWEEKSILSTEWPKPKVATDISCTYRELPFKDKRILLREYFNSNREAKLWFIISLVLFVLALGATVWIIYDLAMLIFLKIYTNRILFLTFPILSGSFSGCFSYFSIFRKPYKRWLEYEKQVIIGYKKTKSVRDL